MTNTANTANTTEETTQYLARGTNRTEMEKLHRTYSQMSEPNQPYQYGIINIRTLEMFGLQKKLRAVERLYNSMQKLAKFNAQELARQRERIKVLTAVLASKGLTSQDVKEIYDVLTSKQSSKQTLLEIYDNIANCLRDVEEAPHPARRLEDLTPAELEALADLRESYICHTAGVKRGGYTSPARGAFEMLKLQAARGAPLDPKLEAILQEVTHFDEVVYRKSLQDLLTKLHELQEAAGNSQEYNMYERRRIRKVQQRIVPAEREEPQQKILNPALSDEEYTRQYLASRDPDEDDDF